MFKRGWRQCNGIKLKKERSNTFSFLSILAVLLIWGYVTCQVAFEYHKALLEYNIDIHSLMH